MGILNVNQQYSTTRPSVANNSGRLNSQLFTFSEASFTKNWNDPQGGTYSTVTLRTVPSVVQLNYNGNPIGPGGQFEAVNSALLTFNLNPRYSIHNGVLYEFDKDIDLIIADYKAAGLELIYNANGLMTFIDTATLTDIRHVQGTGIDNKELVFNFSVRAYLSEQESGTSQFSLIPWENVNLKDNYIITLGDAVVTILGTDPAGGLPATGNTTGDAYFITNGSGIKELHIWDGTQWINNGSVQGPPGPTGPSGPAPDHQWSTTFLQFKKPDGSWGPSVNLQGPPGPAGQDAQFAYRFYSFNYVEGQPQIFTVPDTSLVNNVYTKGLRLEMENPDGTPDEWKILSPTEIEIIATAVDLHAGDRVTIEASTTKVTGLAGADGKSAYQVAVDNGFVGTETEWVISLTGPKGDIGPAGPPLKILGQKATEAELPNTGNTLSDSYTVPDPVTGFLHLWSWNTAGWVNGGQYQGPKGEPGADGKSAYQLWLDAGNTGSEADYQASQKGDQGESGTNSQEILFTPVVKLDKNYVSEKTLNGPVAYTFDQTGSVLATKRIDYVVSDGINKPTFDLTKFSIRYDGWTGVQNQKHRIYFENVGGGKVLVDIIYL